MRTKTFHAGSQQSALMMMQHVLQKFDQEERIKIVEAYIELLKQDYSLNNKNENLRRD